jgi:hypothetical protein
MATIRTLWTNTAPARPTTSLIGLTLLNQYKGQASTTDAADRA